MCSTDTLQLNRTAMFAKIRAGLPEERQRSMNLLEVMDDLLYAWDSMESSLLVMNWRLLEPSSADTAQYQTLVPAVPLDFVVDRLLVSHEGSLIALAGPRGVTIMELPRRWDKNGLFLKGKSHITCRSHNLDGRFFYNNPHLKLRQIRWHPSSPTDSHLLVLLSDNTIRVYDNDVLRRVWQVGPIYIKTACGCVSRTSTEPADFSLGETVVDFDIGPPVKVSSSTGNTTTSKDNLDSSTHILFSSTHFNQPRKSSLGSCSESIPAITDLNIKSPCLPKKDDVTKKLSLSFDKNPCDVKPKKCPLSEKSDHKIDKIEWPIIILRENGNIYVLMAGISTHRPRLQGPITITPQTNDNYGLDSCAILVIPSLPPTLVIAESNGKLHHALFLEARNAEESFNEIDSSINISPSEYTVHVLETVELELGLPQVEVDAASSYMCPIILKRDFINELRYFAYHNAGLHVVTVNFISELQRFFDSNVCSDIATLSNPSRAEYILCTKVDFECKVNSVLGFVLHQLPSGCILLLSSGQVISLKLIIDPTLLVDQASNAIADINFSECDADSQQAADNVSQLDQLQGPSFLDHVKNMLKRTVTQPILSIEKTDDSLSPLDSYELLAQAIEVLRFYYIQKYEQIRLEFSKRLNTIVLRKAQQKKDIEYLEAERQSIRERAHQLADRFEEICEHQDLLNKRLQEMMRQANSCLPSHSVHERDFAQEVEKLNTSTKMMFHSLQKARESIDKQNYHIRKNENSNRKSFQLPPKQENTIKEILLQITNEIQGQIQEIKRMNKIVDI